MACLPGESVLVDRRFLLRVGLPILLFLTCQLAWVTLSGAEPTPGKEPEPRGAEGQCLHLAHEVFRPLVVLDPLPTDLRLLLVEIDGHRLAPPLHRPLVVRAVASLRISLTQAGRFAAPHPSRGDRALQ